MANNENTAKLKFAALKNEADSLGITYQKDITEETLKFAVDAAKEALGKGGRNCSSHSESGC